MGTESGVDLCTHVLNKLMHMQHKIALCKNEKTVSVFHFKA